jgi:hypothetical protein
MYKASGLNVCSKVSGSSAPIDAGSGIGVKPTIELGRFAIPTAPIGVSSVVVPSFFPSPAKPLHYLIGHDGLQQQQQQNLQLVVDRRLVPHQLERCHHILAAIGRCS